MALLQTLLSVQRRKSHEIVSIHTCSKEVTQIQLNQHTYDGRNLYLVSDFLQIRGWCDFVDSTCCFQANIIIVHLHSVEKMTFQNANALAKCQNVTHTLTSVVHHRTTSKCQTDWELLHKYERTAIFIFYRRSGHQGKMFATILRRIPQVASTQR